MTHLQQRERERELKRESEREQEREQERATRHLMELQTRVQDLVKQGLLQMERSPSGHLCLQVVPVVQQGPQKGWCCSVISATGGVSCWSPQ